MPATILLAVPILNHGISAATSRDASEQDQQNPISAMVTLALWLRASMGTIVLIPSVHNCRRSSETDGAVSGSGGPTGPGSLRAVISERWRAGSVYWHRHFQVGCHRGFSRRERGGHIPVVACVNMV